MCEGRSRDSIMAISVSKFLLMTSLSFFAAASSGVLFKATIDELILRYESVLLLLTAGYLEHVDVEFFLRIIDENYFDKVRALLEF